MRPDTQHCCRRDSGHFYRVGTHLIDPMLRQDREKFSSLVRQCVEDWNSRLYIATNEDPHYIRSVTWGNYYPCLYEFICFVLRTVQLDIYYLLETFFSSGLIYLIDSLDNFFFRGLRINAKLRRLPVPAGTQVQHL